MADAPLDMRMDQSRDFTAKDLVNSYPEEKLYEIIKHYGEESVFWLSLFLLVSFHIRKPENPVGRYMGFPFFGKSFSQSDLPGEEELEINSRSKSAKLRIFERGE